MIPNDEVGHSSDGDERTAVLENAAAKAVGGLEDRILSLGGTPEQAKSFKEGMRLGLIGDFNRARLIMMEAGFDERFVSEWLGEVEARMASAA